MGRRKTIRRKGSAMAHARSLVRRVCTVAGNDNWIEDLQVEAADDGIVDAVESHDTAAIFDWLIWILSFQGISDAVAKGYMDRHGSITWEEIEWALANDPGCSKLQTYWAFTGCRYQKGAQTCSVPREFKACPLPTHSLRNGRLNQCAYSLYLFMRDIAGGDIVAWIDRQLGEAGPTNLAAARAALIDPLRNVYGVSDKVIALALAALLMGAGANRPKWFAVGASFIVIDTLVHNFLHRTGILGRLEASHPYGPGCYRPGGCADILIAVASGIDARKFHPTYPKVFPRFIQHAVWRYCADLGFNICNGNQIDDHARCTNNGCSLYSRCDRVVLHAEVKTAETL